MVYSVLANEKSKAFIVVLPVGNLRVNVSILRRRRIERTEEEEEEEARAKVK